MPARKIVPCCAWHAYLESDKYYYDDEDWNYDKRRRVYVCYCEEHELLYFMDADYVFLGSESAWSDAWDIWERSLYYPYIEDSIGRAIQQQQQPFGSALVEPNLRKKIEELAARFANLTSILQSPGGRDPSASATVPHQAAECASQPRRNDHRKRNRGKKAKKNTAQISYEHERHLQEAPLHEHMTLGDDRTHSPQDSSVERSSSTAGAMKSHDQKRSLSLGHDQLSAFRMPPIQQQQPPSGSASANPSSRDSVSEHFVARLQELGLYRHSRGDQDSSEQAGRRDQTAESKAKPQNGGRIKGGRRKRTRDEQGHERSSPRTNGLEDLRRLQARGQSRSCNPLGYLARSSAEADIYNRLAPDRYHEASVQKARRCHRLNGA